MSFVNNCKIRLAKNSTEEFLPQKLLLRFLSKELSLNCTVYEIDRVRYSTVQ